MFVISCKFDRSNPIIYQCLDAIKKHMPNEIVGIALARGEIPDFTNYPNVRVLTYENDNYCEGALWRAYNQFPKEDFFYWIHDSLIIQDNLEYLKSSDLTTVRYFYPPKFDNTFGFGSYDNLAWGKNRLLTTCNLQITDYIGVFGPMFMVKRIVLEQVEKLRFNLVLPTNKNEAVSMERLWGIIFSYLRKDVKNSIQGEMISFYGVYNESKVKKVYLHRT